MNNHKNQLQKSGLFKKTDRPQERAVWVLRKIKEFFNCGFVSVVYFNYDYLVLNCIDRTYAMIPIFVFDEKRDDYVWGLALPMEIIEKYALSDPEAFLEMYSYYETSGEDDIFFERMYYFDKTSLEKIKAKKEELINIGLNKEIIDRNKEQKLKEKITPESVEFLHRELVSLENVNFLKKTPLDAFNEHIKPFVENKLVEITCQNEELVALSLYNGDKVIVCPELCREISSEFFGFVTDVRDEHYYFSTENKNFYCFSTDKFREYLMALNKKSRIYDNLVVIDEETLNLAKDKKGIPYGRNLSDDECDCLENVINDFIILKYSLKDKIMKKWWNFKTNVGFKIRSAIEKSGIARTHLEIVTIILAVISFACLFLSDGSSPDTIFVVCYVLSVLSGILSHKIFWGNLSKKGTKPKKSKKISDKIKRAFVKTIHVAAIHITAIYIVGLLLFVWHMVLGLFFYDPILGVPAPLSSIIGISVFVLWYYVIGRLSR